MEDLKKTVKQYILQEFLPGEDPGNLIDSTPLITGGILDSIGTVKLVAFIEERYGIEFQAHEVAVEHLNTLSAIADFVQAKL